MTSVGTCRLCLTETILCDSHLMPAATYKLVSDPAIEGHAIHVNSTVQIQTSAQVRADMFCDTCEDILNKGGETWVLRNCWRSDTEFPLRDALRAVMPTFSNREGLSVYASDTLPSVRMDQIAHFAAGMFWRASLSGWRMVAGARPARLHLGPYAEVLRRFVRGEGDFPSDAVLLVAVTPSDRAVLFRTSTFPFLQSDGGMVRRYRMVLLGITFDMVLGKRIPPEHRALCGVRGSGKPIYVVPEMDRQNFASAIAMVKKGKPVGALGKTASKLVP